MNPVHTTHSWDFLGIDYIVQYNQLPVTLFSHSFAQYFILTSIFLFICPCIRDFFFFVEFIGHQRRS